MNKEPAKNTLYKLMARVCVPGLLLCVAVCDAFAYTNPQIDKLIADKKERLARLEKCTHSVKGLKIAGISTIGLTGVGVVGNVALSGKREVVADDLRIAQKQLEDQKNNTLGRIVGGVCISEDRPNDAESGIYVESNKDGVLCYKVAGSTSSDNITRCSCKATKCNKDTVLSDDGNCNAKTNQSSEDDASNQTSEQEEKTTEQYLVLNYADTAVGYMTRRGDSVGNPGKCVGYFDGGSTPKIDWCVMFEKYSVRGVAKCVSDEFYKDEGSGEMTRCADIDKASSGKHCFCKRLEWGASKNEFEDAATFVYVYDFRRSDECEARCQDFCADYVHDKDKTKVRKNVFGIGLGKFANEICEQAQVLTQQVNFNAGKDGSGYQYSTIDTTPAITTVPDEGDCNVSGAGEWCVNFDDYIVNGVSACVNSTIYDNESRLHYMTKKADITDAMDAGEYCVCKINNWKPSNQSVITKSLDWVYLDKSADPDTCKKDCSSKCAKEFNEQNSIRLIYAGLFLQ
ncbi:MAG: hypothetical protein K5912_02635 [Alphaproteobacteria bacterium]|nr:hypothetical protein [Alphaproteobacteria bacterium]